ncbi:MAG: recombinase family protein, partial [Planctomycetes bacterium]|nr:recombinase family protein [Planctomycetota bacterium]
MIATLTQNPDSGNTSPDISRESNCNQTAGAPRQFGYARVSTDDQNLSLQIEALTRAGIPTASIFMDKISGVKTERPGLSKCLDTLRSGDILVVWRLDRLGRSMRHLINLVEDLRTRG